MFKPIVASLAAVALLAGTAAFAQSAPPAGAMRDRTAWHARQQSDRLAKLKTQLKITAAQEPAWNGFVRAMQTMHSKPPHKAMMNAKSGELTPAPQVFDTMAEFAAQRAQNAQTLAGAVKKLYGELTAVQRAVLDTHLADMRHAMRHRWHEMRGGKGPHARSMPLAGGR